MDLTEAEDIKKRWQEYTEELYKKDLHDSDNHDGVITHLEPDVLECKVKWALESITMNKASGGDPPTPPRPSRPARSAPVLSSSSLCYMWQCLPVHPTMSSPQLHVCSLPLGLYSCPARWYICVIFLEFVIQRGSQSENETMFLKKPPDHLRLQL